MSSSKSVARAGLFDRLVDHEPMNPEEVRPKRAFNKKEFIDSVLRELNCLLNTRSPIPPDQLGLRERSVIDYGVPDFTALYAKDIDDQKRLTRFLKETITLYEPRLKRVRVSFVGEKDIEKSTVVRIEADFVVESIREPVSFPVVIQRLSGKVNVHVG